MSNKHNINLSAFPAETNSLFAMLMVAVVLLSGFFGKMSLFLYGPEDLIRDNGIAPLDLIIPTTTITWVVVFAVALMLFFTHPRRIRKLKNASPITEQDFSIRERIRGLAQGVGIREPRIEMAPQGTGGSSGQVFGTGTPYIVLLGDGLRQWRKIKQDFFDALLLHELAHIYNGDVWRTYLSECLWKCLTWLLIIPILFYSIFQILKFLILIVISHEGSVSTLLGNFYLIAQCSAVIGILVLFCARLLRIREYYADWQAAQWGATNALQEMLEDLSEQQEQQNEFRLVRFHPSARMRLKVLYGDSKLIRISHTTIFLAGILLAFLLSGGIEVLLGVFISAASPIADVGQTTNDFGQLLVSVIILLVGFLILAIVLFLAPAWLLTGILGVQIQKHAVFNWVADHRGFLSYFTLVVPAIIFTAGVELGILTVPFGVLIPQNFRSWLVELFISAPLLFIATFCYFCMMRFIALRILASQTGWKLSHWRNSFLKWASNFWSFLFLTPCFILSRPIFLEE